MGRIVGHAMVINCRSLAFDVFAACDQKHLRWCAVPVQQLDEIVVLGHHDDLGIPGRHEDLEVRRSLQAEITDWCAIDRQGRSHPWGERRWELIVEPERHAATIG